MYIHVYSAPVEWWSIYNGTVSRKWCAYSNHETIAISWQMCKYSHIMTYIVITCNYNVCFCFRILFLYSFVPPSFSVHNDFLRKSEPAKPRDGGKEAQKFPWVWWRTCSWIILQAISLDRSWILKNLQDCMQKHIWKKILNSLDSRWAFTPEISAKKFLSAKDVNFRDRW